jgi:hypothetical protein
MKRVNGTRLVHRFVTLLDHRIRSPLPMEVLGMSPEFCEGYREGLRIARQKIRKGST